MFDLSLEDAIKIAVKENGINIPSNKVGELATAITKLAQDAYIKKNGHVNGCLYATPKDMEKLIRNWKDTIKSANVKSEEPEKEEPKVVKKQTKQTRTPKVETISLFDEGFNDDESLF